MFLSDWFRSGDVIEIALAALLIAVALSWPVIQPHAQAFARRTGWCMFALFLFPIALRLLLLHGHPVPAPDIYDEFGHLLVADTLRHFRLANPMHPMRRFFETLFVIQEPSYSSIYPVGQGAILALGRAVSGVPWTGVVLSTGAFCSLCYWMLRGWVTPGWALLGGALAAAQFGPLNQWMNNYWGGAATAAAGCLVFGSLPRLKQSPRWPMAVALGTGIAILVLTRPYETVFLLVAALVYLVPKWRSMARPLGFAALAVVPSFAITVLQNHAVTGRWSKLPYVLSQEQTGVPAVLTFQETPRPSLALNREQELDYRMQSNFRGPGPETLSKFLFRLQFRSRYYRFFFSPPLYLALGAFLFTLRNRRSAWLAASLALLAVGVNFFPAFQFHYVAGEVCLMILVVLLGLQRMGPGIARVVVTLCFAHFSFWYAVHGFEDRASAASLLTYETWGGLHHGTPVRRLAVGEELAAMPGPLLVFVHYSPQHIFQEEWVYNEADIDGARIVWARDLGPEEDAKLRAYYPRRTALMLEPDFPEPRLSPYQPPDATVPEPKQPESKKPEPKKPLLQFEPVK